MSRSTALFLSLFFLITVPLASGQAIHLEGTVRDTSGAVIAGATVSVESGAYRAETKTDARGQFSFPTVAGTSGTIEVHAEGFSPAHQSWNALGSPASMQIVLQPASSNEQVTVSAARTEMRLSETPGSTILLSTADVDATPAVRVDDVLRQVPGFSLYRRSDSRVANASNQGVSLRGLGGTASSRALVLEDGLPLVDAFGGWVYWDRVPREEISSVEVFRGGASNLYGSDALGGVIQFITRTPEAPAIALDTSHGNERTPDLSFWTGTRAEKWDLSLASEMFRTDGYIIVPTWQRGSIDAPANSRDDAVEANIAHKLGADGRIFGRG